MFGISANKVGKIANANGMKTDSEGGRKMIVRQEGKFEDYFQRFTENCETGYVDGDLNSLEVDTERLKKRILAKIDTLIACLVAVEIVEKNGGSENGGEN